MFLKQRVTFCGGGWFWEGLYTVFDVPKVIGTEAPARGQIHIDQALKPTDESPW